MHPFVKTPVAARQLNIPYSRPISLLRHGKIAAPAKDLSGDYVWTETDLAAARDALQQGRGQTRSALTGDFGVPRAGATRFATKKPGTNPVVPAPFSSSWSSARVSNSVSVVP